jgi:hypothetical protein
MVRLLWLGKIQRWVRGEQKELCRVSLPEVLLFRNVYRFNRSIHEAKNASWEKCGFVA